jgi:hypothetical protein
MRGGPVYLVCADRGATQNWGASIPKPLAWAVIDHPFRAVCIPRQK